MTYILIYSLAISLMLFIFCRSIIASIFTMILSVFVCYIFTPVLSPDYLEFWNTGVFVFLSGVPIALLANAFQSDEKENSNWNVISGLIAGVVVFLGVNVIGYFILSSGFMHAEAYANILGPVDQVKFSDAIQRLDTSGDVVSKDNTVINQLDVRLVDEDIAKRRMQVLLGNDPEFGGTYEIGTPQLTRGKGRLTWVSLLEYRGGSFSKWANSKGSPGFIWVDAHDYMKGEIVKSYEGKPLVMPCISSAWFNENVERAVWLDGYQTTGLTDFSLELDDKMLPKYVITTYTHRVGFSGEDPTGIVVLDPQTCKTQWHTLLEAPAWVNRIIPEKMIYSQIEMWGEYRNGWWNQSIFGSHSDTREPTVGIALVSTAKDGSTAWYVGITTRGNRDGTTGFMLIDSRTKKATQFAQSGMSEEYAANVMMGKVSEKRGWSTTWPILYNIDGFPTYLSVFKNSSGTAAGIGLIPVGDPSHVVVSINSGDNLTSALQDYASLIPTISNGTANVPGAAQVLTLQGKVFRISSEVSDGKTIYWIILESKPESVFNGRLNPEISLTKEGDLVKIEALPQNTRTFSVQKFNNLTLYPDKK